MTTLTWTPRAPALLLLVVHHGVVAVHGAAHLVLQISLSPFQAAYVGSVIVTLPVIAVALLFMRRVRVGGALLFGSMIGSLAFGVASHALLGGPDNVFELSSGAWATVFQVTSILLAVTEAIAAVVAVGLVRFAAQTS